MFVRFGGEYFLDVGNGDLGKHLGGKVVGPGLVGTEFWLVYDDFAQV